MQTPLPIAVLPVVFACVTNGGNRLAGKNLLTGLQLAAGRFKLDQVSGLGSNGNQISVGDLTGKPDAAAHRRVNLLIELDSIIDAPVACRIVAAWLKVGINQVKRGIEGRKPALRRRRGLSVCRGRLLLPKGQSDQGKSQDSCHNYLSQWVHYSRLL